MGTASSIRQIINAINMNPPYAIPHPVNKWLRYQFACCSIFVISICNTHAQRDEEAAKFSYNNELSLTDNVRIAFNHGSGTKQIADSISESSKTKNIDELIEAGAAFDRSEQALIFLQVAIDIDEKLFATRANKLLLKYHESAEPLKLCRILYFLQKKNIDHMKFSKDQIKKILDEHQFAELMLPSHDYGRSARPIFMEIKNNAKLENYTPIMEILKEYLRAVKGYDQDPHKLKEEIEAAIAAIAESKFSEK